MNRPRSAFGWIRIGLLIGAGIWLAPLLIPLVIWSGILVAFMIPPFLIAFIYTKLREQHLIRSVVTRRSP